jgi:hypothetical protein
MVDIAVPHGGYAVGMRYIEFRDVVETYLRRNRLGRTWAEIRDALDLPYERPCPTWVRRLENEIGLRRTKGDGRALVWHVAR